MVYDMRSQAEAMEVAASIMVLFAAFSFDIPLPKCKHTIGLYGLFSRLDTQIRGDDLGVEVNEWIEGMPDAMAQGREAQLWARSVKNASKIAGAPDVDKGFKPKPVAEGTMVDLTKEEKQPAPPAAPPVVVAMEDDDAKLFQSYSAASSPAILSSIPVPGLISSVSQLSLEEPAPTPALIFIPGVWVPPEAVIPAVAPPEAAAPVAADVVAVEAEATVVATRPARVPHAHRRRKGGKMPASPYEHKRMAKAAAVEEAVAVAIAQPPYVEMQEGAAAEARKMSNERKLVLAGMSERKLKRIATQPANKTRSQDKGRGTKKGVVETPVPAKQHRKTLTARTGFSLS